jgi:hypothetical protein
VYERGLVSESEVFGEHPLFGQNSQGTSGTFVILDRLFSVYPGGI